MLDLGTLQAHVKLDGADSFKQELEESSEKAGKATEGFTVMKGVLADLASTAITKAIDGLAKLGGAMVGVVRDSIEEYASQEQLWGGIQKLYGAAGMSVEEYADTVGKSVEDVRFEYNKLRMAEGQVAISAREAWKTAGMSANQYMESVTGFSASLIESLGGDTQKAAQVADMVMRDIADNANTFGKYTAEELVGVYQAVAKGQYQTLDNLNLGISGTKEGVQQLIEKAEELTGLDLDASNFADVATAIHAVQENMKITGTTEREALGTIEGSITALKASWANLLAAMGDPEQDLDELVDTLIDNLGHVIDNIAPLVTRIVQGMEKILPKVAQKIEPLLEKLAPHIQNGLKALADLALAALQDVLQPIWAKLGPLLLAGVGVGITALLTGGMSLLMVAIYALAKAALQYLQEHWGDIQKWFSELPGKAKEAIGNVTTTIKQKGKDLLDGLKKGVEEKWTDAKRWLSELGSKAKTAVGDLTTSLKQKGRDLLSGLYTGITDKFSDIRTWFQELPSKIRNAIPDPGGILTGAGESIVSGLINGLDSKVDALIDKAKQLGQFIKDNKGPKPYDLKLLVENGQWIMDGLINGIDKSLPQLQDKMRGVAGTIADTRFRQPTLSLGASGSMGTGGTNYNIYINGTQINNDQQIESKFTELLTLMARKGMM